jgi:hypothetical protein
VPQVRALGFVASLCAAALRRFHRYAVRGMGIVRIESEWTARN